MAPRGAAVDASARRPGISDSRNQNTQLANMGPGLEGISHAEHSRKLN